MVLAVFLQTFMYTDVIESFFNGGFGHLSEFFK